MTAATLDASLRAKYFGALLYSVIMKNNHLENDERLSALLYKDAGRRPDIAKRILKDVLDTAFYRLQLERAALKERVTELEGDINAHAYPPPPPFSSWSKRTRNPQSPSNPLPKSPAMQLLEPIEEPGAFAL